MQIAQKYAGLPCAALITRVANPRLSVLAPSAFTLLISSARSSPVLRASIEMHLISHARHAMRVVQAARVQLQMNASPVRLSPISA